MANTKAVDRGVLGTVGPFQVDWPRSVGYFGGIGVAVGLGLIDPLLAVFIAAIPFVKMLNKPTASLPTRYVAHFFEGMAKPVGGDSEGTIRLKSNSQELMREEF